MRYTAPMLLCMATACASQQPAYQLALSGYGVGPEDRLAVFSTQEGVEYTARTRQAGADLACTPKAGSTVVKLSQAGEVAKVRVVAGDKAGCVGFVPAGMIVASDVVDNLMK